jgi:RNA polymerase sigma-70 factor (ECF subfamily)
MDDGSTLVRQAVQGDESALSRLLEQYGPEVERSLEIRREWRSVLDRADIMQVTYVEAFLRIGRFDATRAEPFAAWLRRIAENNLRDAMRGLQRQKRPQPANRVQASSDRDASGELLATLGVATTTPSRLAARDERSARLHVLLDTLPEDYGRVVRLYDLEGLPIAEVARKMNRSPGALHMLRARAHDSLREVLGAESAWFTSAS